MIRKTRPTHRAAARRKLKEVHDSIHFLIPALASDPVSQAWRYPGSKDLADLIRKQSAGRLYHEVVECLIARVEAAVANGHPPSLRRIKQLIDEAAAVAQEPVLH